MEPPFKCTNEGWGEFEMTIDVFTTEKGGKHTIAHDLNFSAPQYEIIHTIQFKNPSQALQQILRETGPLPSDEERKLKKADGGKKKKVTVDVEKMADGMVKLGEDDLLQVIQMIHDGKDDNTYIQNNIDGEFAASWPCLACDTGMLTGRASSWRVFRRSIYSSGSAAEAALGLHGQFPTTHNHVLNSLGTDSCMLLGQMQCSLVG